MIFYFLCLQWDVSNLDIWFLKKGIGTDLRLQAKWDQNIKVQAHEKYNLQNI